MIINEKQSVWIIIPVFNRVKFTEKCLLSLKKQTYRNLKIIIIDDGSNDGTSEMIKDKFPEVILINGDGNYWWSKSVNVGIKKALEGDADLIITLNDDLEVEDDYISTLVNAINDKPNSILCSAGYDITNRNKIIYCGEKIIWPIAKNKYFKDLISENELAKTKFIESDFLPGRGLIIPREVFEKVGLFDEKRFPQSAADYDFSWRVKLAGYETSCYLPSKVYMHENESGVHKLKGKASLKSFFLYLTSLKSTGNIKIRLLFAIKNCPKKYMLNYIFFDFLRVLGSYFKPKDLKLPF